MLQRVAACCSVLQCIAVYCSVLQCIAVYCSVLQYVAACCSVLQCVAVCCSVLQCATCAANIASRHSRKSRRLAADVCQHVKRDLYIRKDTYKRDLYKWKETYKYRHIRKRVPQVGVARLMYVNLSKETCMYEKRLIKRPTERYIRKTNPDSCLHVKRDLYIRKETY